MALVDFTNPAAREWYNAKVRALLEMAVDTFKTDFGEVIPADEGVVYHDGSDPKLMHNYYAYLYNQTVLRCWRSNTVAATRWCSLARPAPGRRSSRCTGAATARRPSSRWPRICAAA